MLEMTAFVPTPKNSPGRDSRKVQQKNLENHYKSLFVNKRKNSNLKNVFLWLKNHSFSSFIKKYFFTKHIFNI
jgi:hypothetical protein